MTVYFYIQRAIHVILKTYLFYQIALVVFHIIVFLQTTYHMLKQMNNAGKTSKHMFHIKYKKLVNLKKTYITQ